MFIRGAEKLQFDSEGNPYYLRTVDKKGTTEKILPEQTHPAMLKELVVMVVIERTGYDATMKPKIWHGLQQVRVKIPNEKQFRYYYLCYEAKSMDTITVKVVDPRLRTKFNDFNSYTWTFSLTPSKDSKERDWIHRVGKAKTVTALKVSEMVQNREIIAVLNDQGEEQVN